MMLRTDWTPVFTGVTAKISFFSQLREENSDYPLRGEEGSDFPSLQGRNTTIALPFRSVRLVTEGRERACPVLDTGVGVGLKICCKKED